MAAKQLIDQSLFSLSAELHEFLCMFGDEDVSDEAFQDTLESKKAEIGLKSDQYKFAIDTLNAEVERDKAASAYLAQRASRKENRIAALKKAILDVVESVPADKDGKHKIKGKVYVFSSAVNGGKQAVEYTGEVPDNYKRVVYETDTEKIRKALDNGEELPFAHLKPRGTHLMIR